MLLSETIADAGDDLEMIRHFAGRIGMEAQRLDGLVRSACRVAVVCADTGYRRNVDRMRRDFVTNVSHELNRLPAERGPHAPRLRDECVPRTEVAGRRDHAAQRDDCRRGR